MRFGGENIGAYGGYKAGIDQSNVAITGGTITGVTATLPSPTFTGTGGSGYPIILAQSGIKFIHISSGSIGNNGALTAITALPTTYSGGAYCYYPANSIAAGVAAGWYWTVFSSTTAGTIYNSTYTSGVPAAGTLTAFATTGPGAFTGDTSERAGPIITLPAGAVGATGRLRVTIIGAISPVNANVKTRRVRLGGLGGTLIGSQAEASQLSTVWELNMWAAGSQAIQVATNDAILGGFGRTGSGAHNYTAVDLSAASDVTLTMQHATATDNHVHEGFTIEIIKP